MEIAFGDTTISSNRDVDLSITRGDLRAKWVTSPGQLYTLIIYDRSAPSEANPIYSPFLHLLVVNIPGIEVLKGNIIIEYLSPSPPHGSGKHKYMFEIYLQSGTIIPSTLGITQRRNFNLSGFVTSNSLRKLGNVEIGIQNQLTAPANPTSLVPVSSTRIQSVPSLVPVSPTRIPSLPSVPPVSPTRIPSLPSLPPVSPVTAPPSKVPAAGLAKETWIPAGADLTDQERKYCRCVLHVAAKQPPVCNIEKAWFEERESQRCYNPYAVCARSVGTTSRKCGENVVFENLPDAELQGYASLLGLSIPSPYNRSKLLADITSWKSSKYK